MKLKLLEKRDEAKGTKSFFWQPEKTVDYLPGQYFYYTLPSLTFPDPRGATRHFTISSSPTEGNILRLTTRIREESGFKKSLDALPKEAEIEGEGPNGTYILNDNEEGIQVFLAGGIGITPFRSMIKYATDKGLKIPIYLVYSNSLPEEIVFKDELKELESKNLNLKTALTVSKPEESKEKWNGLTGRIDEKLLQKLIDDWKLRIEDCTWWVCGPPGMVDAMQTVLGNLKISAGKIRTEKFTGY